MPIDYSRPAGVPSRPLPTSQTKTACVPVGRNVAQYIAREDNLCQARIYAKHNNDAATRARWEDKQLHRTNAGSRQKLKQQWDEEMSLMDTQLRILRHERLKDYYESCYIKWEEALLARGLALVRDRE